LSLEHDPARSRPQGGSAKRKHQPDFDFPDRFLSREEAARYLGLPVSALEHDMVRGHLKIPVHKFGQLCRYRLSELDRWAETNRVESSK
jgi:excisionase family DNA binding protein